MVLYSLATHAVPTGISAVVGFSGPLLVVPRQVINEYTETVLAISSLYAAYTATTTLITRLADGILKKKGFQHPTLRLLASHTISTAAVLGAGTLILASARPDPDPLLISFQTACFLGIILGLPFNISSLGINYLYNRLRKL